MQHLDHKRLLGGELAMWTDHYCENRQCWDEANWMKRTNAPCAHWMYKSEYDVEFNTSLMGMVSYSYIPLQVGYHCYYCGTEAEC